MRVGLKGGDRKRLTFSGSTCFSIERDSLLEDFSLSDILEMRIQALGRLGPGEGGTLRAPSKELARVLYWTETCEMTSRIAWSYGSAIRRRQTVRPEVWKEGRRILCCRMEHLNRLATSFSARS